jgi:outer membrane biosynthesis protein TonB
MSNDSQKKALRVGIFQGERCVEERLIRKRVPITIGQTLSNTFVVTTSAMPKSFKLFDVNAKGEFVLRFNDRMGGRMSLGGQEMLDLTKPQQSNKVKSLGDNAYEVTLTEGARGKVTIGHTRILFNFVSATAGRAVVAAAVGSPLSQIMDLVNVPLLGATLIAALIQLTPLGGIMLRDWPIAEDYPLIPSWKDSLTFEYERPEEKKEEPPPEEPVPDENTTPTDVAQDQPTPEPDAPKPKDVPKAAPKPKVAQASISGSKEKKAAAKSAGRNLVAQKFAVDGGTGGFAGNAIGSHQASAMLDNLSKSDFSGPGKGGAASMLTSLDGDGEGGGTGGMPGLKEVNIGGGGNVVSGGGPAGTGQAPKREQIEVKVKDSAKAQFKGSLSAGEQQSIESIFKKYRSQIENCYKRVISAKGDKRGKLSVIVSINAKGDVMDVKIHTNEVDSTLEQCVVPKIKSWKFPATGKPSQAMKSWVFGN